MSRNMVVLVLLAFGLTPRPPEAFAQTPPDPAEAGRMVTRPEWLRRPNGRDLAASYPVPNAVNRNGGLAGIGCLVTLQGALERCKVLEEKPQGSGFGPSALLLAPAFRMRPMMVDGKAVGGAEVRIRINFKGAGGGGAAPTISVLTSAPWSSTPSPEQVAAAYPAAAAQVERGHVALVCQIAKDGRLQECRSIDEVSGVKGFGQAARRLVPLFRVAVDDGEGKFPNKVYVSLPIDLPNPQKPQPPVRILQPNWLALPEPEDVKAVFPAAARLAKVDLGEALLNCTADHKGYLTGCVVAQEKPAAMGFGQAALALAQKMRINPWTASGSPSDGALVRFPLRMSDDVASAPGEKP